MPRNEQSGKYALEYCREYKNTGLRSLARKLYKEHRKVYDSFDAAYSAIRYYRGSIGAKHRKEVSQIVPRFQIPESYNKDYTPYIINEKNILVIADLHIPYHDVKAIECALEYGYKENCNTILIDGDAMDFHRLSRFSKDIESRSTKDELQAMRDFLKMLKKHFKFVKWKEGNHEERLQHYISDRAPELLDCVETTLPKILKLDDIGVEWIGERRVIHAGRLHVIHSHEYTQGMTSPVSAARGLFLRTKDNSMCAHSHHTSEHTEPTISGKIITTWSVGCLCFLHPQYSPLNKWNHGCAKIRLFGDGQFEVTNKRIRNGVIL